MPHRAPTPVQFPDAKPPASGKRRPGAERHWRGRGGRAPPPPPPAGPPPPALAPAPPARPWPPLPAFAFNPPPDPAATPRRGRISTIDKQRTPRQIPHRREHTERLRRIHQRRHRIPTQTRAHARSTERLLRRVHPATLAHRRRELLMEQVHLPHQRLKLPTMRPEQRRNSSRHLILRRHQHRRRRRRRRHARRADRRPDTAQVRRRRDQRLRYSDQKRRHRGLHSPQGDQTPTTTTQSTRGQLQT